MVSVVAVAVAAAAAAAQSIGNYVAQTRSVADVCGELRYVRQLRGPERRHPSHGECEREVICEDPELAAF